MHCDYIEKKANRRLYALKQLRKSKIPSADIVHIHCALVRSILGYAFAVFAGLPKYLACYLENVQKGSFPSFDLVLRMKQHLTKLHNPPFLTVGQSRVLNIIGKVRPGNQLYPLIHNRVVPIPTSVCLRSGISSRPMATKTERFSNFVSVKY